MDADESAICFYLKGWPGQFIGGTEIARRAAGRKRFRDEPGWAAPVLSRLEEKGILEGDADGHYRLKPSRKDRKARKWLSPQIKKILEQSGKEFKVLEIEDTE